jgi:homoserine dehydrogenase
VVDLCGDIIHGVKGGDSLAPFWSSEGGMIKAMEEVVTPYYLRFTAVDRPGVLSKVSGILGEHEISIASVIQKGRKVKEAVPIVMMTHEAKEKNVRQALRALDGLDIIQAKTTLIRVEAESVSSRDS